MLFGPKKIKELDQVLTSLQMDASNNYKDAAQANFKKYCDLLDRYLQDGKLKEKQALYYKEQKAFWEKEMNHYTHKDQKVTW